jgi:hypothetical protein
MILIAVNQEKIFGKQDNIKSSSIVSRMGGDRVIWQSKEFQLEPTMRDVLSAACFGEVQ